MSHKQRVINKGVGEGKSVAGQAGQLDDAEADRIYAETLQKIADMQFATSPELPSTTKTAYDSKDHQYSQAESQSDEYLKKLSLHGRKELLRRHRIEGEITS